VLRSTLGDSNGEAEHLLAPSRRPEPRHTRLQRGLGRFTGAPALALELMFGKGRRV